MSPFHQFGSSAGKRSTFTNAVRKSALCSSCILSFWTVRQEVCNAELCCSVCYLWGLPGGTLGEPQLWKPIWTVLCVRKLVEELFIWMIHTRQWLIMKLIPASFWVQFFFFLINQTAHSKEASLQLCKYIALSVCWGGVTQSPHWWDDSSHHAQDHLGVLLGWTTSCIHKKQVKRESQK